MCIRDRPLQAPDINAIVDPMVRHRRDQVETGRPVTASRSPIRTRGRRLRVDRDSPSRGTKDHPGLAPPLGSRTSLPEYPPASRRAGEAGTVQLRCFVKEDGRCSEVSIVKSSGFNKLDEAAVKEVQRNWKFVPGKEDGKPVAMWHTFAVTFKLTD